MTASPSLLAQSSLAASLWWWTAAVLEPARSLKRAGLPVADGREGEEPIGLPRRGLGPYFSKRHRDPVLLGSATQHDHLVAEFDRIPEVYEAVVRPFSQTIFDEALIHVRAWLGPDWRLLDAGCGPGRELRQMAALVPRGEVVGIDLAAGMVETAHASARAHGYDNCAFFQADVGDLPRSFAGRFDLVYNCLAHHHYPSPEAAAREALRVLRDGGLLCVVDPGPAWFNRMSAPLARASDPGWIGFKTPTQFRELFNSVGFARSAWISLLPGFGLAVAQKRQPPKKARKRA
jgi:ubiquinone/menaquinone biosynthesis C-methylase UbiE